MVIAPSYAPLEPIDDRLVSIARNLDALPWIEKAYYRAFIEQSNQEQGGFTDMPHTYDEQGRYFKLAPTENVSGFCFAIARDPIRPLSEDERVTTYQKQQVDFIFFANDTLIKRIPEYSYGNYRYISVLERQTREILNTSGYCQVQQTYNYYKNVWGEFGLQQYKEQFYRHPFITFKHTVELTYQVLCF